MWVSRPTAEQRRRYTGRISAGTLRVGDPVLSLPAGTRSTVTALDTLDDTALLEAINAGPLSNSRFIEPIGEMNIHFGYFLGKGPTVAPAWVQV